jgi:hypothetical protein
MESFLGITINCEHCEQARLTFSYEVSDGLSVRIVRPNELISMALVAAIKVKTIEKFHSNLEYSIPKNL